MATIESMVVLTIELVTLTPEVSVISAVVVVVLVTTRGTETLLNRFPPGVTVTARLTERPLRMLPPSVVGATMWACGVLAHPAATWGFFGVNSSCPTQLLGHLLDANCARCPLDITKLLTVC